MAEKTDSRLAARLAAISSCGAAVIHFAVVPAHWQEWTPAGLFFASIAVFQLVWAVMVSIRPSAGVLAAGIVANVGAAALWAVSRTAGAPFGPHAGEAEVVEAAGICVLLLECYVVMGAGWVWYRGRQPGAVSGFGNVVVSLGAGAVIAAAATAGVASGLQHGHHGPADAEADHHAPSVDHEGHHDHPSPVAPLDADISQKPMAPAPVEAPLVKAPLTVESPAPDPSHDTGGHHHHD